MFLYATGISFYLSAYFTNLNTNVTVNTDLPVDGLVYIIETNDDHASVGYGIIMKEESVYFYLNLSNTRMWIHIAYEKTILFRKTPFFHLDLFSINSRNNTNLL